MEVIDGSSVGTSIHTDTVLAAVASWCAPTVGAQVKTEWGVRTYQPTSLPTYIPRYLHRHVAVAFKLTH